MRIYQYTICRCECVFCLTHSNCISISGMHPCSSQPRFKSNSQFKQKCFLHLEVQFQLRWLTHFINYNTYPEIFVGLLLNCHSQLWSTTERRCHSVYLSRLSKDAFTSPKTFCSGASARYSCSSSCSPLK